MVQLKRFYCRRLGLGHHIMGSRRAVEYQQNIRVSQTRVSQGVIRIHFDRLLEMLDAFPETIFGALVPVEAALQIMAISLSVLSMTLGQSLFLFTA